MTDTTTPELMWEEPPKRHRKSEWIPVLTQLRENPGKWARLRLAATAAEASAIASSVRRAADLLATADDMFEVISRAIPEGGAGVWAFYSESAPQPPTQEPPSPPEATLGLSDEPPPEIPPAPVASTPDPFEPTPST